MSVDAGTARVKFVGDYSQLNAGLASALSPSRMKSVGLKAGLALGGAFAVAGVAKGLIDAVSVTKDFEKQMSSLGAVANASGKEMEKLRKQAIRMGAATVYSASEAAKAQTELAKGGLNASQILGGALKSSLNLAAAGELDLADAAAITVNAMDLFNMKAGATGKVADMLATAANRTTGDVEDFAMALRQGGSVAKLAGYDLNETVVVLEALATAGIKNSDAGTSMKASILQLLNPTKKQAELAEKLGISWIDQNGALKDAVGISRELTRATADMTQAERAKTFGILAGQDGIRTLNALYAAGVPTLRKFARANQEQGTAAETARKKTNNLAGDIEQLSGAWETFQITVGSKLTPMLRDLTQGAADAVNEVTKIFNNKNLSNSEKFNKLVQMGTEAALKGLEELTKAAVKAAPDVATAFAEGFASAPIWMQVAGAGLALKMIGGPGAIAAQGARAGVMFSTAFNSTFADTYWLGRSFGRSKGASALAGFGALGMAAGSTLMKSLARTVAPLAASLAIGDVLATAITGDMRDTLIKLGSTLAGGGIGFLIGGPVGAAIGAGIGSALSDTISGLFGGGEVEKTLRQKIRESSKRLASGIKAEVASISDLQDAVGDQVRARGRQKRAAEATERAERALNRARRQHGPNSERARAAEARYRIALDKSREAEEKLRRASRLQGAARRATARIIRDNVQEAKANIGRLREERVELQKHRAANLRNNGSLEELKTIQKNLRSNSKQLDDAQEKVNKSIQRGGSVIGPKFAKALERINTRTATMSRVLPQLSRITESSMSKSRTATQKTSLKFQAFGDVVIDTRRSFGANMRALPKATGGAMSSIQEKLQENLDQIQNLGTPQSKRHGGLIEAIRQRFGKGGVPVAVSPGEMFKTPDGKTGIVPGTPTAADNVLTTMPVGTKIFTYDGQGLLASGASESEALRKQRPHFAKGGIVKPEIVGGTKKSAEVANAAVGTVHDKASAKLKKERERAAAAAASSGSFNYTGPPADMRKLGDNAWVDSHTLAVGDYLAKRFNTTITDGWRPQDAGYGASNSSHKRGTPDNPGALDFAIASAEFQSWVGQHVAGITENLLNDSYSTGPHNHVAFFREGGILGLIGALRRFQDGGFVGNINKTYAEHNSANGDWGGTTLPSYVVAALAQAAGRHFGVKVPGVTMEQITRGESGAGRPNSARPGATGIDPGGTKGLGLWMITTGFNDALIAKYGGEQGMLNPVKNAAAMVSIFQSNGLGAWYGDGSVTSSNAHYRGGYDLRNALGGVSYSQALAGKQGDRDLTPAQERKRERAATKKQREARIEALMGKARSADSARAKKGAYWQILDNIAKWGDFEFVAGRYDKKTGAMVAGRNEAQEMLVRASQIASIPNPNRGAGQLYQLVKGLMDRVDITGLDENDHLSKKLQKIRDKGKDTAKDRREKIFGKLSRFGTDFPWEAALNKNLSRIEFLDETASNINREVTAEWSEFGSEYSQGEIDQEKNALQDLLSAQDARNIMITRALWWSADQATRYRGLIAKAEKNPKERWKLPGYRRGLRALTSKMGTLQEDQKSLMGSTGQGGTRGDTFFQLRDLWGATPGSVSAADSIGMSISDLLQFVEGAKLGIYDNLPTFHTGGQVPGPKGADVPIMAQGGEWMVPEDQVSTGGIKVIVKGDIVSSYPDPVEVVLGNKRFKAEVQREIREDNRGREARALAGVR